MKTFCHKKGVYDVKTRKKCQKNIIFTLAILIQYSLGLQKKKKKEGKKTLNTRT